jgi:serine/threonine protein kinase
MSKVTELPETIGKYEILGVAGRGALGVVYRGYDPYFDREVAVQVTQTLSAAGTEHAVTRKMLLTEATAAGKLDHGTIVEVLDVGESAGEPYVVMEYVTETRILREHCFADNLLRQERALAHIYHCAKALHHVHQHGVIHRDIKPSNIVLTADGQTKISDFGLATIASTETTIILGAAGSPRYMSPKQFMELPLGPTTDLYSLGVVLYEVLTGVPAFKSRNYVDLAREVTTLMPTAAHELRADVSPELSAIVIRAINKRPTEHFASGADFTDTLTSASSQSLSQQPHHQRLPPPTSARYQAPQDLAIARGRKRAPDCRAHWRGQENQ